MGWGLPHGPCARCACKVHGRPLNHNLDVTGHSRQAEPCAAAAQTPRLRERASARGPPPARGSAWLPSSLMQAAVPALINSSHHQRPVATRSRHAPTLAPRRRRGAHIHCPAQRRLRRRRHHAQTGATPGWPAAAPRCVAGGGLACGRGGSPPPPRPCCRLPACRHHRDSTPRPAFPRAPCRAHRRTSATRRDVPPMPSNGAAPHAAVPPAGANGPAAQQQGLLKG